MKKSLIYSLIFSSLFITGLLANTKTAAAFTTEQVCKYVNYQHASVEYAEKNKNDASGFEGILTTTTEERLGPPDEEVTFNCFRVINCSMEVINPKPTKGPEQKRVCSATYSHECSGGTSDEDLPATIKDPSKPYTLCEPVMIYVSKAGNQLLYHYMGQIYTFAATLGGLLAVLIMIVAGIMYTTAGDNNNQTTMAKGLMIKCISGLVVLFLSALILYIINPNFFTAEGPDTAQTTTTQQNE